MSGYRLPGGGQIDRSRALSFSWDDTRYMGYTGDTVASALMARGERIYLHLMSRIKAHVAATDGPTDIDDQLVKLADIYHCNFSLFQSLPAASSTEK